MKVGILTYHSALNFGANLQTYSTYCYFKNRGYSPVIIDYVPDDLRQMYASFPKEQEKRHYDFIYGLNISERCRNSKDVSTILKKNRIQNVVIGSDAVVQHHPFLSRIVFPSRTVFSLSGITSDRMFPNPFWGCFLDNCSGVNAVMMSVSSQQAKYHLFTRKTREEMLSSLSRLMYVSVRDTWTANMISYISGGKITPPVTPDPVFAFNYNCTGIPSREYILEKFCLPEKYIVLSLRRGRSVSDEWVKGFEHECESNGYRCVGLPFPYGYSANNVPKVSIPIPLSPLEWYAVIKYSGGYVGHNMHTIVSALHNSVPCYSFDQYGQRILGQFVNTKSSKIYDILSVAGYSDYRSVSGTIFNRIPQPQYVFNKLLEFDRDKCQLFAEKYYSQYLDMMLQIENCFV